MSDTPIWLAGWYATKLHAVDRGVHQDTDFAFPALCGARVYASPHTEWAARRLAKNPPKCKRCLKLLGERAAPSEVDQLRAEVARLRLTEAEREAVLVGIEAIRDRLEGFADCKQLQETLRGLLARHGGGTTQSEGSLRDKP